MTLRLNGDSSGFTEIKAADAAGDNSITLPTSNGGANQLLQNGGTAGALRYTSAGGGLVYDSTGRLLVGASTARSNFFNSTNSARFQIEGNGSNDNYALAVVSNFAGSTNGAQVILGKSGSADIGGTTLVSNGNTIGRISYQGSDGTQFVPAAEIRCDVNGDPGADDMPGKIVFATNSGSDGVTNRVEITSDGALKLLNGCPGIDFSAIQTNTAGMTSETLDGYEEGTFTPSYLAASGDLSSAINQGVYVKVGSAVFFSMRLGNTQASFAGVSGQVLVQGLPFTVGSSTQQRIGGASVNELYRWGTNFSNFRAYPLHGTTAINLNIMASNAGGYTNLDVTNMLTGTNQNILALSGWYTTVEF